MKKVNESRISDTYSYIEDCYMRTGAYPTYREIQEAMGYSTLSLLSADISKLKSRGLLVDDGHRHVRLSKEKENHSYRYDFPLLIMCDAGINYSRLNDEEKMLYDAQDAYLKGDYELAKSLSESLLSSSSDQSVIFGARFTLCWSAIYTGEASYWKDFFRSMISYQPKTTSEKLEKELMAHFLTSLLKVKGNCPKWLEEGRFYNLRKEAYPFAGLLFIANGINNGEDKTPNVYEPLCSLASISNNDAVQVYEDLYLAIAYRYAEHGDYLSAHLNNAIKTCLRHGWLTPLVEVSKTLGSILRPILDKEYGNISSRIDELAPVLADGYNKIYSSMVGDNPLRDLTFREVEVMNFIHVGLTNKEIADKLFLSTETVKYYLSSIYTKLGVSGRKELKEKIVKFM